MQVFERRDWVAAQVQQQADSYAQTLACSLLAAGHRPPDWLLPSRFGGPQQGEFISLPRVRRLGVCLQIGGSDSNPARPWDV